MSSNNQDIKSLRLLAKRHKINLTLNGKYKTKAMLSVELNKLATPASTPVQSTSEGPRSTPAIKLRPSDIELPAREIHIQNDEGKKTIHIPPSVSGCTINIYMSQHNTASPELPRQSEVRLKDLGSQERIEVKEREEKVRPKDLELSKKQSESKYDEESKYKSQPPPPAPPPAPPSAPPQISETPDEKAKRLEQSAKNREEAKLRLEQQTKQAQSANDFLASLKEATEKRRKKLEGGRRRGLNLGLNFGRN